MVQIDPLIDQRVIAWESMQNNKKSRGVGTTQSLNKIVLKPTYVESVLEKIQSEFSDAQIDTQDGLKLSWQNSWVHIRKSNTEPIIRIYAEASTKTKVEILMDKVKSAL